MTGDSSLLAGSVHGQRGVERGEDEEGGAGHARALALPEAAQAEDGAGKEGRKDSIHDLNQTHL